MRNISIFVETDNNVLEMSEDIFLSNNDFSSARLVVSIELIADERTDDSIICIVKAFQYENLSVLDIFQAISGYQSNPVIVLFTIRHDTFDSFTIVGSHSIGVSWCSC